MPACRVVRDGLLVGIDVGTTATKVVALGVDGVERSAGAAATPWDTVPTGAQVAPEALLEAVTSAVRQALHAVEARDVVAVGVASMAETGVVLAADGRPLAPAVVWSDRRAADDGAALMTDLGARQVARRAGLEAGPKLSAAMFRWLARNEPGVREARRWLSVAEWIVHALGGEAVAEASLASRTGWLDLDTGDWWPEALAWSGIDAELLPAVRRAGSPAGAAIHDLVAGAVLTVAGHDHQAAAVGAGAIRDGDVLDSCGTAEAFVRAVPAPVDADTRGDIVAAGLSVGRSVLPERLTVIGGFPSGARLQRVLDRLSRSGADGDDRSVLDAQARRLPAPPAISLDDLDALLGSPDDLLDRAAELHGLTSPAAVWRAAATAVAGHGAAVLGRLDQLVGPRTRLVAVGGWAADGVLAAAKEQLLGPLVRPRTAEAGARGAAVLAGVAAGVYPDATAAPTPEVGP